MAGVAAQVTFLGIGWGAVVALAKAARTKAGKWVIIRIIALVSKIPDIAFPFGDKVYTIPFSSFAAWSSSATGATVITVLLMSTYSTGRRACKCLVC